ncbi:MAG: TrbC/VirB2 family protein [Candidatus Pacebacteria bacterium]|nr:TrbC/VirB2 family protein [Candidatus Paceibacterota bacterium]
MPTAEVSNPLASAGVTGFLESLLGSIMYLAYPIIALVVIYAGFMFIIARGNRDKLQTATKNITYVVLGIAVVLGSYTIVNVFYTTVVKGLLGWN